MSSSSSSSISTRPCSPAIGERDDVNGLETWDDPTPRRSHWTVQDLCDAFVAASKRQLSQIPPPPSREERARRRQERERSVLLMALNKYAKENNIQPSELQLVEVKATNYIYEYTREYLHYNLLVRSGSDCTQPTMFFAEVKPGCQGEEDVYLCTPLQETNNKGPCFSCKHRAKDLMHPVGGGYLGGHKETGCLDFDLLDSDDDEYM